MLFTMACSCSRSARRVRAISAGVDRTGSIPLETSFSRSGPDRVAVAKVRELISARSAGKLGGPATPYQLVVLTDGRGNIALDGSTNRAAATEDGLKAARAIAAARLSGVVIDISARPRPEAAAVAAAMQARYLPLPQASAATLSKVIGALT